MSEVFETKRKAVDTDAVIQSLLHLNPRPGISPSDAGRKDAREAFSSARVILERAAEVVAKKKANT